MHCFVFFETATGALLWEGVHRAMTRKPGDLPAWVALCHGPGVGYGTVSFPSERRIRYGWGRMDQRLAGELRPFALH